jgi:hypothetical protein
MPLPFRSDKEIDVDQTVKKLKSLYGKYAEKHGSRAFNLAAFEERYKKALRDKLNLRAFLHAEITAFEELKKKAEGYIATEPPKPGYAEIADGIIEKNLQKVRKYRSIDFHPDAEIETKHLLGACTDFYEKIWRRAARVLKPLRVMGLEGSLAKLENDFIYFVLPFRGSYSRAVDDYALVLSRRNARDSEKAAVNFIRFGGILLNNCLRAMTAGINALEDPVLGTNHVSGTSSASGTNPVSGTSHASETNPASGTISPSVSSRVSEGFERHSDRGPDPLQELLRCRDILLRLIEDFRLGDIRGY